MAIMVINPPKVKSVSEYSDIDQRLVTGSYRYGLKGSFRHTALYVGIFAYISISKKGVEL